MGKLIRRFEAHQFYKTEYIKEHLESMALKGYKLNKVNGFNWYYEQIPPTKLIYDIYFTNELNEFENFEYITTYSNIHFYCSECEDINSIINDEETKLKIINENMTRDFIPILTLFVSIILIQLFWLTDFTIKYPIDSFGANIPFLLLGFLLIALIFGSIIIKYFLWYFKSKKQVKEIGCYISKKSSKFSNNFALLSIIISVILITNSGITFFNNLNNIENNNTISKTIVFNNGFIRDIELNLDDIPLKLQDLGVADSDYFSYKNSKNMDSLFLKYNLYYQSMFYNDVDEKDQNLIHVDYSVTTIKFAPIYNIILNSLIDMTNYNSLNTGNYLEYKLIDHPTLDKFYQKYENGEATSIYVLCKGDKLVNIEFYSYIPSEESINMVIEILL